MTITGRRVAAVATGTARHALGRRAAIRAARYALSRDGHACRNAYGKFIVTVSNYFHGPQPGPLGELPRGNLAPIVQGGCTREVDK